MTLVQTFFRSFKIFLNEFCARIKGGSRIKCQKRLFLSCFTLRQRQESEGMWIHSEYSKSELRWGFKIRMK